MKTSPPVLLTHASQLLTLRGLTTPRRGTQMLDLGIIPDGAILTHSGAIVAVGSTDEVTRHTLAASAEEIDCRGKVILPGFVDSHTHPAFTAPRLVDFEKRITGASYEEIAEAGGGIRSSIAGVRDASAEQLSQHVTRALAEMAKQGTTTVEAKSGYGLSLESEMKSLRAIKLAAESWHGTVIPTLLGAHVVPPEYRDHPEAYVAIVCEQMIPAVAEKKLAEYVDVFCEKGAFSLEQTAKILRAAAEPGLKTRVHVCQLTQADLAPLLEFHPASLDHMDYVSDADLPALAKSETVATLLPAVNYFLGLDRFPPARKLIDAGVALALATDFNPGSSPTPSMPFVLSAACTHMKMSPAEAITASTINGACALNLQHRKGSLEPGKDADIAVFDVQDYREIAYWFGVNRCERVFLRGTAGR
ncbi:MAG: imidazolonepropionase [Candidatus Korobacteraceae bacterium]